MSLVELLEKIARPQLSEDRKKAIREHLLSQIALPVEERKTSFFGAIFGSVADLMLDSELRASLRARILEVISDCPQKHFFVTNFLSFHKKLVSGAMLFALFFGMFAFVNVDTRVVRAAGFTKLDHFSGGVMITRDDVFVEPYVGMEILEEDEITTGENGEAVISYFDDSVSRLASESKLVINRLDDQDSVRSYVEVSLESGVMWSRVVDLVESRSAFVVEVVDVYTKASKAAFNLSVDENMVEIGVFSNAVNVELENNDVTRVMSGQKAVVENGDVKSVKLDSLNEEDRDLAWVQTNLENDRVHISEVEKRLLAAKMDAIGLEVDDEIDYKNSLRENALVFLTFDDVKKKKLELDLAEKKFVAAQVKLHDKDLTDEEKAEADAVIADFALRGVEFKDMVKEVAYTDEEYAAELKLYLEDKMLASKKELAVASPDSPLYEARKVVEELELSIADVDEVVGIKLAQVAEKLVMEEEDLVVKNRGKAVVEPSAEVKTSIPRPAVSVAPVVEEEPVDAELVIEGLYGVTVQGGKPLPPLF